MMRPSHPSTRFSRRTLLQAMGGTATTLSLSTHPWLGSLALAQPAGGAKKPVLVRAAFLYPPTESLRQAGYYSWPGANFDAEGRQRQYTGKLQTLEANLGIRVSTAATPHDEEAGVPRLSPPV